MVYLFGGGLCGGYTGTPGYNGSTLVLTQDVVVVTVSYRLGALGFLPLADFPGTGSGGMNGASAPLTLLDLSQTPSHSNPDRHL